MKFDVVDAGVGSLRVKRTKYMYILVLNLFIYSFSHKVSSST